MITGVGCDIVEIARIERALERQPKDFSDALLSPLEKPIFIERNSRNRQRGIAYLATRWAAKEALAKALGTGIRNEVILEHISVLNNELGMPYFRFDGQLSAIIEKQKLITHLSISDSNTVVVAFVVCERKE